MDIDRIVRERERHTITGVSRTTWWEQERAGRAPGRVQLIGGRVGWRLSELVAWVRARPAAGHDHEAA